MGSFVLRGIFCAFGLRQFILPVSVDRANSSGWMQPVTGLRYFKYPSIYVDLILPHLRYSCTSVKSPDSSGRFVSHHSLRRVIVISSAASRLVSVVFKMGIPKSLYR